MELATKSQALKKLFVVIITMATLVIFVELFREAYVLRLIYLSPKTRSEVQWVWQAYAKSTGLGLSKNQLEGLACRDGNCDLTLRVFSDGPFSAVPARQVDLVWKSGNPEGYAAE